MGASCRSPLSFQLIHYRDQIQSKLDLDTNGAQQHCAELIGAQIYSWQAWESASELMPPELWQRFKCRVSESHTDLA